MDMLDTNSITNANIYLNGKNLAGRASEFKLPDVAPVMIARKALGMIGEVDVPSGGLQKMEGEITWASFFPEVFALVANPFKSVQLTTRAAIQRYDSSGLAGVKLMVATLTATFTKNPMGQYKAHENTEFSSAYTASALKVVVGGRVLYDIDFYANRFLIDGRDPLNDLSASLS